VLVAAGTSLSAYAVSTGARRWSTTVPAGCTDGFTTAGGAYVCPSGAYAVATGQPIAAWLSVPARPVACAVAASGCLGLRDAAGRGWSAESVRPVRRPDLDPPDATLVNGRVYRPGAGDRVLGSWGGLVLVLGPERFLREIDPVTGAAVRSFPLRTGAEKGWDYGGWQIAGGYLAIERLKVGGRADPDAPDHYFDAAAVLVASV
jgi:hypothetical protein